jgi:hypothetical protein
MSCGTYTGAFSAPAAGASQAEIICRGGSPLYQGSNWYNYWAQENGQYCSNIFSSILYGLESSTGLRHYDPTQLARVQADMENAFATYTLLHPLVNVNQTGFNVFQETLLNTCENIPGLCTSFLNNFCTNCTSTEVSTSPLLLQTCGCFIAPPSGYNISTACGPSCNRADAIHDINPTTGAEIICSNNTCVIDNVSINAAMSTLGGGVVFSQLCNNCKAGCSCIISSNNINGTLQQVGLTNQAQINLSCGAGAECLTTNSSGTLTPVTCPNMTNFQFTSDPVNVNNYTIILIVLVVLVIVIALCIYYIYNIK